MPRELLLGISSFALTLVFLILAIQIVRKGRMKAAAAEEGDAVDLDKSSALPGGLIKLGAAMRPQEGKSLNQLKLRIMHAGLYSQEALDLFLTVRLVLLIVGLVAILILSAAIDNFVAWLALFMTIVLIVVLAPSWYLDARMETRHREIGASLAHMLDLLAVCLDAGLGLQQALERVSVKRHYGSDLLASEIRTTLAEMKAGVPIDAAFNKLASRIGMEEITTMSLLISQTALFGTNISKMIRDHIKVFRQTRLLLLEEKAGKANAKLTLPLCLLLLPAVLTLLLGPAIVQIVRTF